jgi:isoleucyl-tRNA synthetase
MTERIGFWVDLEHAYVTMDNSYIESCWWAIKQMWDKRLIYQGYKVTPHCPRCGTSLSSHEVALGYRDDAEDPSVYVKFRLTSDSKRDIASKLHVNESFDAFFLAWTTTPWTLPGNTALAVAPDADYAVIEVDDEYLIIADALRERVGLGSHKVVAITKGSFWSYLEKAQYEPLFNPHAFGIERQRFQWQSELDLQKPNSDLEYKVIDTDFVSMEEGTGIVHVAPAFGEVDFEAGIHHGLDFVQPVDLQGYVTGSYPFSGRFVKDADPLILKDLEERGLLFRSEKLRHTYPFCWRCEAPLLYYAKQTWYTRTTAVKDRLISGNQEINWYPDYIKYGRFGDWLQNNVDWAFSRERYWGTPLPIWCCEACGNYECAGSVTELKDKPGFSGFKEPLDLHRPFVDEVTFDCPKCDAKMRRVPEVIDCWFDSGAMPIAQCHYPFENKELFDDKLGQADYICEAVDQTRGWFYSLHAISTLLFSRPCFKNVICLGHILDDKGEKMSKAKGNVVEPMAVIDKYGADALRWYCLTASPPGNVRRFSEKLVAEITRRFLLTLWNVYSFFVTYANIDHFVPDPGNTPTALAELDRWIISELNQLTLDVDRALNTYNPTEAGRKIESFVNELSNWYVRRSRRRFWKSENDADKLSAYNSLYQCLVTLAKLVAPFLPFLAEELYQNLVVPVSPEAPDSVHLADFPVADKTKIDKQLAADTQLAMKVSNLGRAARSRAGIKVRQPLPVNFVSLSSYSEQLALERVKPQILEELNVKDIKLATEAELADMARQADYVVDNVANPSTAIYTEISPELLKEGLAREIVHRLQTMRRAAGFEIADHIVTYYQGDDYVRQIMEDENLASYIKQETLSRELNCGVPQEGAFTKNYKLSGHEILLGVRRLD